MFGVALWFSTSQVQLDVISNSFLSTFINLTTLLAIGVGVKPGNVGENGPATKAPGAVDSYCLQLNPSKPSESMLLEASLYSDTKPLVEVS